MKNLLKTFRPQTSLFIITTALLSLGLNSAQALDIKDGKWGITTEVNIPMAPEPVVEYLEECLEGGFDPMKEMFEENIEGCEVLSSTDSDSLLEMTLECTIPNAGTMQGEIFFEVFGDTAAGRVDMVMDMGGISMTMDSTWSGEYLGACTP